ncbi:pentatricopeptide repeat-containing protein At2g02750 [Primulina huaijiensis]|uniref:pentatricopeptide repeat-containing protein At2g02750 n=1 Tax=Primulina huaijiensis TaxID=1492673 RepID=UPI003CC6F20F
MTYQIARLVKDGLYKEAITLFTHLHSASVSLDKFTFPYLLKACAQLKSISHGQILHAHLLKTGRLTNRHTFTDLINMYMKFHLLNSAVKLFDEIQEPTLSALNVVISGFSKNGLFGEASRIFKLFSVQNLKIDAVTVATVLSACENVENGVQVQCLAIKIGVDMDVYAATSLMVMYLNYGELVYARRLFGLIEDKNVVCYNAFLSGLVHNGVDELVFCVFNELRESLFEKPNSVTMITVLSACANSKKIQFGKQLHGFMRKVELMFDTKVGTGLVDMYSKCGYWQCAYDLFKEMGSHRNLITWNSMIAGMMSNDKIHIAIDLFMELELKEGLKSDSVTWNSMISGFSRLGKADEAFFFFRKMQSCGLLPSLQCLTSLLAAASSLSALNSGKQIHAYVVRMNAAADDFVAASLIDMYMKCGRCSLAYNYFKQLEIEPNDPAVWNAMISGYGKNGKSEGAFDVFNQMVENKVEPNLVTFSCLLSVCSHTGQVEKAFQFFRLMTIHHGLNPNLEHMNILIGLLGRVGRLDEAFELLRGIPETSASVFASLLGACGHHADSTLGEEMAKKLSEIEPENPIPSVILSNIYAVQKKWKDVHKIREIMNEKGQRKNPGLSSTGVA